MHLWHIQGNTVLSESRWGEDSFGAWPEVSCIMLLNLKTLFSKKYFIWEAITCKEKRFLNSSLSQERSEDNNVYCWIFSILNMYANRLLQKRKDNTHQNNYHKQHLYCALYIIIVLLMFDLIFKFGSFSLKRGINHCIAASVQTAWVWVPHTMSLGSILSKAPKFKHCCPRRSVYLSLQLLHSWSEIALFYESCPWTQAELSHPSVG